MNRVILLAALWLVACSGPASQPTATPAVPTPPTNLPTSTPVEEPGGPGLPGGSATVILGDRSYAMSTEDLCQTIAGLQTSMATADGQASVTVIASGSSPGMFVLLDLANNERWTMADGSEGWIVNGSTARWSGTLEERDLGRTASASIEIRCGA